VLYHLQNDTTAKALVDDLAQLMAANISSFDARGLANSAWAFGKLKYAPSHQLPALIAAAAVDKIKAFSAQNMSNLLWSFVYLHHKDERLLKAVARQVCNDCVDDALLRCRGL
jgi:UDP-N-acetylmuramoylalanine-D-glutamate ligase